MENSEPEPMEGEKDSEEASQAHVVSQKDIHDFWDHVSTEERINDVCTTFESESKQVTRKLYASSASMGEKFAVANFLLQVGALQFRVQKNPEDENELQTIIILQKPDITPSASGPEGQGGAEEKTEKAEEKTASADDDDKEDEEAPWKKDPETAKEEPQLPPPEHHECTLCDAVLTSLWELDLHLLSDCGNDKETRGRPRRDDPRNASEEAPPTADGQEHVEGKEESQDIEPEEPVSEGSSGTGKRGRPKKSHSAGSVEAKEEDPSPRKRGRPRKSDGSSKKPEASSKKTEKRLAVVIPPVGVSRSKRKRRLPIKLRDFREDSEDNPDEEEVAAPDGAHPDSILQKVENIEQRVPEDEDDPDEARNNEDSKVNREANDDGKFNETHMKGKIDKTEVDCHICFKKLKGLRSAERHIRRLHSSEKMFKCSTCGLKTRVKDRFKRHLIMHKNKATNTKFACEFCSAVFYDKYSLTSHERIHTNAIQCDYCDKKFTHASMMKRHRNNVHTKEKAYPCTLCDKVFYLKARLKDHMVSHSGKKEHVCDICGIEFFLMNRLKMHKKVVHVQGKPFLCDLCGTGFKSKVTLKQHHLTTHTDIKEFPCRQCGKLFSRTSLRNQHEKVHAGVNPYPCEHCGKGFRDKFKLQVHVNWHLGIHPFCCEICNKTFLVKGNMTKHMRIHTGERPYVCGECGRGCVDSSQLKKHMAQAHNIHVMRRLTKGPERADGALPSKRTKRRGNRPRSNIPHDNSMETQAYTIATDALIEISQQLADMSNSVQVPAEGGQLVIESNAAALPHQPQQGGNNMASVVPNSAATPAATGATDGNIFPVVISVNDQNNQVTVPVTQSISDFQSLELISLWTKI